MADYANRWESLRTATNGNIYCNYDLTRAWLEVFHESSSPRAILVEDGGELVSIAPLATSKFKVMGMPMTALSLVGWGPNTLGLVTNSIMCLPESKDALRATMSAMRGLKWSVLFTENMEDNSTIRMYIDEAQSTWRTLVQTPNNNHVLTLRDSGDISEDFTRNGRKSINRTIKLLEQEGHDFALRKVSSGDIDRAVDVYVDQHIDRWATKGGSYFKNPLNCAFLNRSTHVAYDKGFGFVYEFLIDREVAGQIFGFWDREGVYFYRVGMSNSYSRYMPGRMALYLSAMDIRDAGGKWCVLGGGDQRFKKDMGSAEISLIGLKATRGATSIMERIMNSRPIKQIDSRLGITDKLLKTVSVEKNGGEESSE